MSILKLNVDGIEDPIEIELCPNVNAEFFSTSLKELCRPADKVHFVGGNLESAILNFLKYAREAKEIFKFNWDLNTLTQENFNHWHKDIETFDISKHPPVTKEKEHHFFSLHTALHKVEGLKLFGPTNRTSLLPGNQVTRLQISWFEYHKSWPVIPKFGYQFTIGDVIVDYPHVGKSPWQCLKTKDNSNLKQTCRLPDACPPGFLVLLENYILQQDQMHTQLIQWYKDNEDQLKDLFTIEEMLAYSGEYKIGTILNKDQIPLLQKSNITRVSIIN